jgi:hypothetical protein
MVTHIYNPSTQKAGAGQGHLGLCNETLSKKQMRTGGVAQGVEHLLCKHKTLSPTKQKNHMQ